MPCLPLHTSPIHLQTLSSGDSEQADSHLEVWALDRIQECSYVFCWGEEGVSGSVITFAVLTLSSSSEQWVYLSLVTVLTTQPNQQTLWGLAVGACSASFSVAVCMWHFPRSPRAKLKLRRSGVDQASSKAPCGVWEGCWTEFLKLPCTRIPKGSLNSKVQSMLSDRRGVSPSLKMERSGINCWSFYWLFL